MRKVDLFEIRPASPAPAPSIRLARTDGGTPIDIDAASLLAQYLFDDGDVLLVLDEDTPYEEQLHLVLVRETAIVDHLLIGAPYAPGIFREKEVRGDTLAFRFEGDTVWTVGVDGRGSHLPVGLPPGARRRGGWLARHYLSLSKMDVEPRSRGSHDPGPHPG